MNATSFRTITAAALGLALVTGVPCATAVAQTNAPVDMAQAKALFNEGLDLRDKGDVAGALEKLKAAYTMASTPITGLELGRTYVLAAKLVEAQDAFATVARLPVAHQETARSTAARATAAQLAEQLRARIPQLTVKIVGAPAAPVTVTIDGAAVPSDGLSAPHPVNPGTHEIIATDASGAHAAARADLKEGEKREVELSVGSAPPAAQAGGPAPAAPGSGVEAGVTAPATNKKPGKTPVLVYGGFGLAGVGIVAGTVTGLLAMGKASSVNDACHSTLNCPRSIDGDLSTGRTMGTVSTIAFAAAGVGAVVGVVGLVLGGKKEAPPHAAAWVAPWVLPGGAGVSGTASF
jgi:hypothetical protein